MNRVQAAIKKLGGMKQVSRKLGHRHPTTVQGWIKSGNIRMSRVEELLDLAKREGVDLCADDFFRGRER